MKTETDELSKLATSLRDAEREAAMLRILMSTLNADFAIRVNLTERLVSKCHEVQILQSAHCRLLAYIAVPSRVNANFVMVSICGEYIPVAQLHEKLATLGQKIGSPERSFDALLMHILDSDVIASYAKRAVMQVWGPINERYLFSLQLTQRCLDNASRAAAINLSLHREST